MPIYEYRCIKCERVFEELILSASAHEKIKCPECGSEDVEKLMSAFRSRSDEVTGGAASSCSGCSGKSCSTCR